MAADRNTEKNRFADALARHDQRRLRAAFEQCNDNGGTSYDRTTLTRWLDGSVPTRGQFIRCLAERLEDEDLYSAWEAVHGGRSSSASRSVVSRFENLPPDERDRAYPEIRKLYLARFPAMRSRFSVRVDLSDDRHEPDLFEVRVTMNWTGRLPAEAKVSFATDFRRFHDAFEDDSVLFGEMLRLDQARLHELLSPPPDRDDAGSGGRYRQVLAYSAASGPAGLVATSHDGRWAGDGVFAFDNEEADDAQVRLSLSYPYRRRVQQFPLRFGRYRVDGRARIEFVSHCPTIEDLRAIAFMPSGQARDWSFEAFRPDELVVYLGERESVLSDGDGVVLSWIEREAGGH